MTHVKYLLIGAGLASSAAAGAIRSLDANGSILMIGQDVYRPYHRPPLSKEFLRHEKTLDELFTRPADWFDANHVGLRTGRRASFLDTSRHVVLLDSAEEVVFDRLLIATGASAATLDIPGAKLPNVLTLRTIADSNRLDHTIAAAKLDGQRRAGGQAHACIIGGGILGVELAASIRQIGADVDLIVAGPYPWARFAGESTGLFITRILEKHGVRVHLNTTAARLEGDGRAQRVLLSNGQHIACDFVVMAVGAIPNKDLLRGTAIAAEKAILVDAHCRTSVPDIFSAGDCAAIFDPLFGKHRILDHLDNARACGEIAGENMAGKPTSYEAVNYFFSDVFDLSLGAWGEARFVNHRVVRGRQQLDGPQFIEIGVGADGRVSQVLSIGQRGMDGVLKGLVARRLNVGGLEEQLKDPDFALETL